MQEKLKDAIEATAAAESDATNVNSIVKLMALNNSAQIPDLENGKESLALEVLQAEMRNMRQMMEVTMFEGRKSSRKGSISAVEYERISNNLEKLVSTKRMSIEERIDRLHMLMKETDDLMHTCINEEEHMHFRRLMERIHRAERDIIP